MSGYERNTEYILFYNSKITVCILYISVSQLEGRDSMGSLRLGHGLLGRKKKHLRKHKVEKMSIKQIIVSKKM